MPISQQELLNLKASLTPLIGLRIDYLALPDTALLGFEPSQIAVIVNTLIDGILPQIQLLAQTPENRARLAAVGLTKAPGLLGQREGYPDFVHISGKRLELKGHFVDNKALTLKRPPTKREPSARLKENVRMDNIDVDNDALLIAAVQLQDVDGICSPFIIDIEVLSVYECLLARDNRLLETGGKWINRVPKVYGKKARAKARKGLPVEDSDYERDTNFGKLKRIPYPPLINFLAKWT